MIKNLSPENRPREKLLNLGASTLSDAELLAIFLRTGVKGLSAIELAQKMLDKFGGVSQLFSTDVALFTSVPGIGRAKFAQVQAALELSRRHLFAKINHATTLTDTKSTQDYLALQLRDRPAEVFACLFLDNRHRVLKYSELFYGTIDQATVHPREIMRHVFHYNAAAVILAHNHPSGDATPSDADIKLTNNIISALDTINVRVLDHIIVGWGETISFADAGLL